MKDEPQSRILIEFGPFLFDKTVGKLSKHGTPVRLRGMPLKILHHLVERPGEVVSRAELQGLLWNGTAFGDFEQGLNSAVNVLRTSLNDSADQPRYIETVPRHGYRFIAPLRSSAAVPEMHATSAPQDQLGRIHHQVDVNSTPEQSKESDPAEESQPPLPKLLPRTRGLWVAVLGILPLVGFVMWTSQRRGLERNPAAEALRAVPLTTAPGVHRYPSFSPEGDYVTFTWTLPREHTANVYVQQIGGDFPLKLTNGPNADYSPVWSPDGRFIAFLRRSEGGLSELRLIPPLGGPERKLAEIRPVPFLPVSLAWCPDSKCLVVTDSTGEGKQDALFGYSLETGEKKQLTYPPLSSAGDTSPTISSDGGSMVFRRDSSPYTGELYWLPLTHRPVSQASATSVILSAAGEPRRLTPTALDAGNPAFLPNGEEILFSARGGLWRLLVGPGGKPARLAFVGEDGIMPVVSHPQPGRPFRLVYVRSFADWNIWRVNISAPGATASSPPAVYIASTKLEWMPSFSSDGRRVTFVSNRSGEAEIWAAVPDGSNASQLTSVGANPGAPRWSPDGALIAFHSNPEGQAEVYVVPSTGGKPRNITSPPANGGFPSFSRDGRWIYFCSHGTGGVHIWKVPVSGGSAVEVTRNEGMVALESPDGAYIYYVQAADRSSALWRMPVSGGDPIKVLDEVWSANFVVLDRGIYYIDRPSGEARLQYFDFATHNSRTVVSNLGNVFMTSLTASPDGSAILYARLDSSVDDVMLVEDFR